MSEPIFTTDRLYARPWSLDDAEAALCIYGDPEVMGWLVSEPYKNVEEQRRGLQALIERNALRPPGMGGWALIEKGKRELVGQVMLKPLPDSELIEVGWHLARAHWEMGYATEAGRGALAYGFGEMGLETIYAIVRPVNDRSIAVTQRLGMSFVRRTREFHDMDHNLYSITREAFEAANRL